MAKAQEPPMKLGGTAQTLVGRMVEFPDESLQLLDLAHLMIAAADPSLSSARRQEAEQLEAKLGFADASIQEALDSFTASLTDEWVATWLTATLGLIAVQHPWYVFDDLAAGPLHRRIDRIFDHFETDFCAHEAQGHFAGLIAELVDAAESRTANSLRRLGQVGMGAAGGLAIAHGFVTAPMFVNKGVEWLEGQGKTKDSLTVDLATLFHVWSVIPGDETNEYTPIELGIVLRCRQQLKERMSAAIQDERRIRLWVALLAGMGDEVHAETSPDLCGKVLSVASLRAGQLGLSVTTVDGLRPEGSGRVPLVESNWRVVAQHPPEGETMEGNLIVLTIAKSGENCPTRGASALASREYKRLLADAP